MGLHPGPGSGILAASRSPPIPVDFWRWAQVHFFFYGEGRRFLAQGDRPDLKRMGATVIGLLEADIAAMGCELLAVRLFRGGGRVQVRVYVDVAGTEDRDGGITLDEVAAASRTVGMLLEEADLFAEPYVIEVSSPGIRRPLRTPAHFDAAVGQRIDVKVREGKSRLRGVLESREGRAIRLRTTESTVETANAADERTDVVVDLDAIVEANLDPIFDAQAIINADRRRRKDEKRRRRQERSTAKKKKSRPRSRDGDAETADGAGNDE